MDVVNIPYREEVEFRVGVWQEAKAEAPPAPAGPLVYFVLDEKGELVEHEDVAVWHAALSRWGALPAVRENGWLEQTIESCVWVWKATGLRPVAKEVAQRFNERRSVISATLSTQRTELFG
jgi:hypothetical protein